MADAPQYPANDFQQGFQLLQQLGSFWLNIFQDEAVLQQHVRSVGLQRGQTYLNYLETVACLSRFTVPVFHTEDWFLLILKKSESEGVPSVYADGNLYYGPQPAGAVRPQGFEQTYGGTDRPDLVQCPLPPTFVDAPWTLQNMVVDPTKTWIKGIDYDIDTERNLIRFRETPFDNQLVPTRYVYGADGQVQDQEIAIWAYKGKFDLDYVYTHFGYVLGIAMQSSQFYKDLLNRLWDMYLLGASVETLRFFLSALSGAPLILGQQETVEVIQTEEDSILIVTDLNVYRVVETANLLVEVGETYFHGDPITDAFQIIETSGAHMDLSILPYLSLSNAFTTSGQFSDLTFKNSVAALDYLGLDADDKAVVRFEVSGFPSDVERFWTAVQERGQEPGKKTLAEYLDTREDPVGQPTPADLPATINPMEFIITNLMRNNLFIMRIRQASFDPEAPGVQFFRELGAVVPPHTTYVVFIDLAVADTFNLAQSGDSEEAGVEEEIGVFFAAGPVVEEMTLAADTPPGTASYGTERVYARQISLNCQ